MAKKFPKGNGKRIDLMHICDPEILKTEKFGSRDNEEKDLGVCCICGVNLIEEEAFFDVVGNGFCSNECREKKFMDGRCKVQ